MTDVESVPLNPYNDRRPNEHQQYLPAHHPIVVLKRMIYSGISLYGLYLFKAYDAILQSPLVRHEWFKIGLASSIAFLLLKVYVEIFEGKINKKQVNYNTFRQSTHAAIALLVLTSLAFNISLWPHYGWNTPVVLSLLGFGVILQFILLFPTWVQNLVAFIVLAFFLQEYQ